MSGFLFAGTLATEYPNSNFTSTPHFLSSFILDKMPAVLLLLGFKFQRSTGTAKAVGYGLGKVGPVRVYCAV